KAQRPAGSPSLTARMADDFRAAIRVFQHDWRPARFKASALQGRIPMFSHVMLGTNDIQRSKTFYDAVLATLGIPAGFEDKQPTKHRVFWRTKTGVFGVSIPINGEEACHANGGTVGFACATPELVHAFHEAGVKAGGTSIED